MGQHQLCDANTDHTAHRGTGHEGRGEEQDEEPHFLFETKYPILFHFARNLWVFCTKVHGGAWDFIGWFLQRAGYYTITTPFYGKETGYDTNILPFKTFAPSTG